MVQYNDEDDEIDPVFSLLSIEDKDKAEKEMEKVKLKKINIENDKIDNENVEQENIRCRIYEDKKEGPFTKHQVPSFVEEPKNSKLKIIDSVKLIKETLPQDMQNPYKRFENTSRQQETDEIPTQISEILADLKRLDIAAMTTDNRLFFDIVIGGVQIKALCDTGSNGSYLGPKFYENFKHRFKPIDNTAMMNATG